MFSKKLLIPLLSLSLLVTPAYSSHAAENTEAAETSVEGQGMLSPSSSSESSESVFNGSGAGTSSEPVTDEKLETILKQVQSQLPAENGTWAVFISDLVNGTEGSLNDQKMQAASLIKLYIMGAVYENYDQITGQYGRDSVDSNLYSMITVSDNDAANELTRMLGGGEETAGMEQVNVYCQEKGYKDSSMGRMLLADSTLGENYTSAEDCGNFLFDVCQGRHPHAEQMLNLLKQQQRTGKIPAGIPEGVETGNKTGELADVENDAAIVWADETPYILCVMADQLTDTQAAREKIVALSSEIYSQIKGGE